jgi:hypothetical protein
MNIQDFPKDYHNKFFEQLKVEAQMNKKLTKNEYKEMFEQMQETLDQEQFEKEAYADAYENVFKDATHMTQEIYDLKDTISLQLNVIETGKALINEQRQEINRLKYLLLKGKELDTSFQQQRTTTYPHGL